LGQIVKTRINRFDGGISNDKRDGWIGSIREGFTTRYFGLTKHFDVFTYPKRMVPYHKTKADETKTYDIVKFLVATPDTARIYGFGIHTAVPADKQGAVYVHNASLSTNGWTLVSSSGTDVGDNRVENVFFYYKDYIYFWAGAGVCRYEVGAGGVNTTAYQSVTFSSIAQPVHHPADDIAYFFHDNYVNTLSGVDWSLEVLTLPDNFKIVAACPYGNYLAIACVDKTSFGMYSVVYLWDRDSSLATLTERIDFGEGEIKHIANLNNKLIAVMNFYLYTAADYISIDNPRVLIKQANQNFAVTINEILADDEVADTEDLWDTRFISGDKLYFPATIPFNSDTREGIWVIDEFGKVTLDFIEEDAGDYQGILRVGNSWWIAHSDDGSIQRSDNAKAYSTTLSSVYESLIFNAGDSSQIKELKGVTVSTEKLPTAGQVVLKYRIDGGTTWIPIFTETTNNSIEHSAVNIEATGVELPQFKEIELQINSTGGAVITGLGFDCELTDSRIY